jgi:hypothetical protein
VSFPIKNGDIPYKSPFSHGFPMVFPRFSHETSCDFRGFASVLHAALETCAGPTVLALVQRLERESCERCEASEKVGTGGGMEVKLGNIQL